MALRPMGGVGLGRCRVPHLHQLKLLPSLWSERPSRIGSKLEELTEKYLGFDERATEPVCEVLLGIEF